MKKILSSALAFVFIILFLNSCSNNTSSSNRSTNGVNSNKKTEDFSYELMEDGTYCVRINSWSTSSSLTIPTSYNGKSISTLIGSRSSSLRDLTIPNEIKKITDESGFLKSYNIHISDLLNWCEKDISIGGYGYLNLYLNDQQIKGQLIIPDGVTVLKKGPISSLKNIFSITLPLTLTSIEEGALGATSNYVVEIINYSSLPIEAGYKNYGGIASTAKYVLKHKYKSKLEFFDDFVIDESTVIGYIGEATDIVFPVRSQGQYSIGRYAFYGSEVNSIVFSNSVSEIQDGAFNGCRNLTNVSFPSSLKIIGDFAFSDCENLTTVSFPSSIKEIGYKAFNGCEKLKNAFFSDPTGWYYKSSYTYTEWSYWSGNHLIPAHEVTKEYSIDIEALDDEVGAAEKLTGTYCNEVWYKK